MIVYYITISLCCALGSKALKVNVYHKTIQIAEALLDMITELTHDKQCVVMFDEKNLVAPIIQFNNKQKYITFIQVSPHISKNRLIQQIAKAMNEGCNSFVVSPLHICNMFEYIYKADKLSEQRNNRRYLILYDSYDNSSEQFLACKWIPFFPYIYHLIPSDNNSLTKMNSYNILTHTLGENLKPKTLELIGRFNEGKLELHQVTVRNKLSNLEDNCLMLLMMEYFPESIVKENGYDGVSYITRVEFSKKLNCTWMVSVIDSNWGHPSDNETSGSYYGTLHSLKYQVSVPTEYVTASFLEHFDYSIPLVQTDMKLLTPAPRLKAKLWSIFTPLQLEVWVAVVGLIFCVSFVLYLFSVIRNLMLHVVDSNNPYGSYSYSLLYSISLAVGSGVPNYNLYFIRQLLVSLSVTSILLATAYNCNLVSFLTIAVYESPIDTLQESVDSGLQWGTDDMIWVDIMAERSDPVYQTISKRYLLSEDYEKLNELVKRGEIAVVSEQFPSGYLSNIDFLDSDVVNGLHITKENLFSLYTGFIFHKGSPLREMFNIYLRHLRDSGILTYWTVNITKQNDLPSVQISTLRSIALSDISGLFIVLLFGFIISFVDFVGELWCYSSPKKL